jgi:hypothetical protein
MLNNTYALSSLVAQNAVSILKSINNFVRLGNSEYTNMFTAGLYAPGDTINLRLDNFAKTQRGNTVTAEAIQEATIPLTILPLFSHAVSYYPTDLSRNIIDFSKEVIAPAVRSISTQMDAAIALGALTQISHFTGDPTAPMNTYKSVSAVNPLMDKLNMNNYDRFMVIDPDNSNELISSDYLRNSFLDNLNKDITLDSRLGRLAGFELFKDTNIKPFFSGTHAAAGDITIETPVSSGSTLALQGFTAAATIKAGDLLTLEGVYEYDSVGQTSLNILKQFTVTADATANGSGDANVTVFPPLIADGTRQNFFVPGADPNVIPANTVVNFVTNTTSGYMNNVAFTGKGLALCIPPLHPMDSPYSVVHTDPETGISMRVSKTADVLNNVNILRIDAQMAFTWINDQCVRKIAQAISA